MRTKKERRGKRFDKKQAVLTGVGLGLLIMLCICLTAAILTSNSILAEEEMSTLAVVSAAVGCFASSLTAAKIIDVKTGALTTVIMLAIRLVAGAFSGGRLFGKTTLVTLAAMLIAGLLGAMLGGRRVKRRIK